MIYTYGVTQQGAYHIKTDTVCQDAQKIQIVDKRYAIGAVADGLGSELYTDVASKTAVGEAVSYCAERICIESSKDMILNTIKESFQYALDKINEIAKNNNHDVNQYDTTLALVVYINGNVYYGNSGDSGIIVLNSDGTYESITVQQRDDYGCVFPLCFGEKKWEFGEKNNVGSVLLATDGMYETFFPYLLKGEDISIYVALAHYMMNDNSLGFLRSSCDVVQDKMETFVANIPQEQVSDDKTVLLMLDSEVKTGIQPAEYYKTPNWNELKKKKDEEYRRAAYPHLYENKT